MPFDTREAYLTEASALILDEILMPISPGAERPPLRISVGWPKGSRGGKVVAQCFKRRVSADGVNEIFVTPEIDDPVTVLEALVHEIIHAIDDCESGHRNYFARTARKAGLVGKLTATKAGDALAATLREYSELLGAYPHHRMDTDKGRQRQTTRMLKIKCGGCGFTARASAKWIEEMPSTAVCPVCEEYALASV